MISLILATVAVVHGAGEPMLRFERERIGTETYEAASVMDVDKDGKMDIVSGGFWYAGPDFQAKHKIATILYVDEYYDDFSDYPMDVNGDGYLDIVAGGWLVITTGPEVLRADRLSPGMAG